MTGISNEDVADAPALAAVAPELLAFVGSDVAAVMAHNANFDIGFLRSAGIQFHRPVYDTLELAGILAPGLPSYSLGELCHTFGITIDAAHHALDDAAASAEVFVVLQARARQLSVATLRELLASAERTDWPYTHFFEDALAAVQRQPAAAAMPAPPAPPDPPALRTGDLQLGAVSEDELAACFMLDGPLAQIMGPTYELRDGQVEMARQVMAAFNAGDYLLIEAGTGTGKSLAYLLPAALFALANRCRVLIATNTIALQDQLVDKDIPQVQAHCLPPRPLRLPQMAGGSGEAGKGRAKRERRKKIVLQAGRAQRASALFLHAPSARMANQPPAQQRRVDGAGQSARLAGADRRRRRRRHRVVVNHALLLADLASEGRILPPYTHLIVDETHRLEEAATDQLTWRVTWPEVRYTLAQLSADGDLLGLLHRTAADRRHHAVLDLLPETAAQARRSEQRLRGFADLLATFARGHEQARADAGYSQRLALDSGARSQPMWSRVEIEWDDASRTLHALHTQLTAVAAQLEQAQWREDERTQPIVHEWRSVSNNWRN
jgi:ATP-dependent DNA helicase DinG